MKQERIREGEGSFRELLWCTGVGSPNKTNEQNRAYREVVKKESS